MTPNTPQKPSTQQRWDAAIEALSTSDRGYAAKELANHLGCGYDCLLKTLQGMEAEGIITYTLQKVDWTRVQVKVYRLASPDDAKIQPMPKRPKDLAYRKLLDDPMRDPVWGKARMKACFQFRRRGYTPTRSTFEALKRYPNI